MIRLMQTASGLTLAAALAAAPLMATAQQSTESNAEQAVEEVVQETEEAAGEAAQAVGEAAQEVEAEVQETEQETQAVEGEVQETQAAEGEVQELEVEVIESSETEVLETQQTTTSTDGNVDPETNVEIAEMPVAEEVPGAIRMQDENSILTSELMNGSVYSVDGEKIGDIDDAIVSLDGTVEGVLIGVGGFLGIGEKHVAVEMQQISVRMDENNEPQLILDTTREALEAAPEFVTAEDQRREAARQQVEQSATGAAPVEGGMMTADPAQPVVTPAEPAAQGGEAVIIKQD